MRIIYIFFFSLLLSACSKIDAPSLISPSQNLKLVNVSYGESPENYQKILEEINCEEDLSHEKKELALKYDLGTPGSKLLELNDFIFDLAITANRPDGMSVVGIAREISALLESKFKCIKMDITKQTHCFICVV